MTIRKTILYAAAAAGFLTAGATTASADCYHDILKWCVQNTRMHLNECQRFARNWCSFQIGGNGSQSGPTHGIKPHLQNNQTFQAIKRKAPRRFRR